MPNKDHPSSTHLKVPLQSKTKSGKVIFAYLRRSTAKKEQADSLIQQEDGIDSIVKRLWYENEDIRYFAETFSGFENKKRKKWWEMIEEIDKLKKPCIIIARDISRLSRNPTDSQWIMDRIYWDNKKKKIIDTIITLDFENLRKWNSNSDKESFHKTLSSSYYDSLETKRKSIWWILLKLEKGCFPYHAPKWLDSYMLGNDRILKQNKDMSYVRQAFEMKIEGKTHKVISKYLMDVWGVKIWPRELTDRLFRNTVYIGEYTEKNTWSIFNGLRFFEWVSPISNLLWKKVQDSLGKKRSNYGDKQEWDLLAEKLRTEEWRRMSRYLAKGKYPNYTNAIEKIHISESAIIHQFLDEIVKIIDQLTLKKINKITPVWFWTKEWETKVLCLQDTFHSPEILENLNKDRKEDYDNVLTPSKDLHNNPEEEWNFRITKSAWKYLSEGRGKNSELISVSLEDVPALFLAETRHDFIQGLSQYFSQSTKSLQKSKEDQIESLEREKAWFENEKKKYRREAIKYGYSKEEIEDTTKDIENSIILISDRIDEMSENSDMEKYFKRLPEILVEIFELTQNTLIQSNTKEIQEDIMRLIEISTFELTLNNKKELQIKLFGALEELFSSDNVCLEAPSGIEPEYKALQASA